MDDSQDKSLTVPDRTFSEVLEESASSAVISSNEQIPQISKLAEAFRNGFDEEYSDLQFTDDEARSIRKYLSRLRTGGAAGVGLVCAGDRCVYRNACPLWRTKDGPPISVPDPKDPTVQIMIQPTKAPMGKLCPLEATVIGDTRIHFYSHDNVELVNPVHRAYINELCQLASMEWRVNMLFAYDFHGVTQKVPAAISADGVVYHKHEKNQLIEVLEYVNNRRSKIMRELTITPEAHYKRRVAEGIKEGDSLSRRQAAQKAALKDAERMGSTLPVPKHVKEDEDFHNPVMESNDGQEAKEK